MANIHHNTAKRAQSFGIELIDLGNIIEARVNGKLVASGANARLVLDEAISEVMAKKTKLAKTAPKAKKTTKKAIEDEGDDEDDDSDEGDDEAPESEEEAADEEESKELVKSGYRAIYRQHGDSCGDDLATFLAENFKDGDGAFMPREFIAFIRENDIDPGQFAVIADKNAKLPNGFMGRARMTLRNRLNKLVKTQGFVVYNGRKRSF